MNKEKILLELDFKAVRSSGSGGQNVNKVSSKVVLTFDLENSSSLSDEEKEMLKQKLSSKLTQNNVLEFSSITSLTVSEAPLIVTDPLAAINALKSCGAEKINFLLSPSTSIEITSPTPST